MCWWGVGSDRWVSPPVNGILVDDRQGGNHRSQWGLGLVRSYDGMLLVGRGVHEVLVDRRRSQSVLVGWRLVCR
jgi:hypothetical protein